MKKLLLALLTVPTVGLFAGTYGPTGTDFVPTQESKKTGWFEGWFGKDAEKAHQELKDELAKQGQSSSAADTAIQSLKMNPTSESAQINLVNRIRDLVAALPAQAKMKVLALGETLIKAILEEAKVPVSDAVVARLSVIKVMPQGNGRPVPVSTQPTTGTAYPKTAPMPVQPSSSMGTTNF